MSLLKLCTITKDLSQTEKT